VRKKQTVLNGSASLYVEVGEKKNWKMKFKPVSYENKLGKQTDTFVASVVKKK